MYAECGYVVSSTEEPFTSSQIHLIDKCNTMCHSRHVRAVGTALHQDPIPIALHSMWVVVQSRLIFDRWLSSLVSSASSSSSSSHMACIGSHNRCVTRITLFFLPSTPPDGAIARLVQSRGARRPRVRVCVS